MVEGEKVLALYRLEEVTGCFEAGICAMVAFGGESHGRAVGAAGVGVFVISGRLLGSKADPVFGNGSTYVPLQCHARRTMTGP